MNDIESELLIGPTKTQHVPDRIPDSQPLVVGMVDVQFQRTYKIITWSSRLNQLALIGILRGCHNRRRFSYSNVRASCRAVA